MTPYIPAQQCIDVLELMLVQKYSTLRNKLEHPIQEKAGESIESVLMKSLREFSGIQIGAITIIENTLLKNIGENIIKAKKTYVKNEKAFTAECL